MENLGFGEQRFDIFRSHDGNFRFVAELIDGILTPVVYIEGERRMVLDITSEPKLFDTIADRYLTQEEARFRLRQAGINLEE
jgi:hypothetical protein